MSANDILVKEDAAAEWLTMYIAYLRDQLHLQGWEIRVKLAQVVDGEEHCNGCVELEDRYHVATLTFQAAIEDTPFWREVVRHEMLEIKLAYITNFVRLHLTKGRSKGERRLIDRVYTDYKERFIQDVIPFLNDQFEYKEQAT